MILAGQNLNLSIQLGSNLIINCSKCDEFSHF